MNANADHRSVIAANRTSIVLSSLVVLLGSVLFWFIERPNDAVAFLCALLVSAVSLGVVIGYRSQKHGAIRLWTIAYPVSWRVGCIWLVTSAGAEAVLTDWTITHTLNVLTPAIFMSTVALAVSVVGGWFVRRVAVEAATLTRNEWLQIVGLLVAVAALIISWRATDRQLGEPEKTPASATVDGR